MNLLPLVVFLWQVTAQPQQPCVILKRMGPADQVTSHLSSFGLRGKQFMYVEGELPKGVKFHGRLTDNDVRKITNAGGRVAVVESHYTDQDLEQARKSCSGLSSEAASSAGPAQPDSTPNEKETDSVSPAPPPAAATTPAPPANNPSAASAAAPAPAAQPAPEVATEDLTTAVVKSDPPGADVTVDGKYMGSTPSTVRLAPGDHTILLEKAGFKAWQRTMAVNPGGIVTIDATLAKQE
jgi:hypothetical protein